jgi:hypothetical protein
MLPRACWPRLLSSTAFASRELASSREIPKRNLKVRSRNVLGILFIHHSPIEVIDVKDSVSWWPREDEPELRTRVSVKKLFRLLPCDGDDDDEQETIHSHLFM